MTERLVHYRRDIDGLRAIAVMAVVFCHVGLPGFAGGFVGVDVFFVISGFLITGILMREIEDGRFSVLRFYERRARRILPAIFALLAVGIVAGYVLFPPWQYEAFARSALATIFFQSNIWFLREIGTYFGTAAEYEPLLHTWSLAVEEQTYILFPLLLWLVARRGRRAIMTMVAMLTLLSFALSVWAVSAKPLAAFFLTPMRAWELGIGSLLALGAVPGLRREAAQGIAAMGLAMICVAVAVFDARTAFPGLAALLPCLGAAALIWSGMGHQTVVGRLLSSAPFVGIGVISYSLYLWHWPLLVGVRTFKGSVEIGLVVAMLVVVLSMALAWISWAWIERPFRRSPVSGGFGAQSIFVLSGSGAAVLVAASYFIAQHSGLHGRLPGEVDAAYSAATAFSEVEDRCRKHPISDGLCRIGPPSTDMQASVLVWGDSHAAALLPGVDLLLRERGLAGVAAVKDSCPPLAGGDRLDQDARHRCAAFNEAVLKAVHAERGLTTVVLIARWALVVEGKRAPGEQRPEAVLGLVSHASGAPALDNAKIFEEGLDDTLRQLRGMGMRVILLGGIPEIGASVPRSFVDAAFLGRSPLTPPDRTAYDLRHARTDAIIAQLAARHDAQVALVADLMCRPTCQVQAEGTLLYRDADHLSIAGANWLVTRVLGPLLP